MATATLAVETRMTDTRTPETALRAAARRCWLTMAELAAQMSVTPNHLAAVATGRKRWTPLLRERALAVLGEVPGQEMVYRQGGAVSGESSCIRERARALGMSNGDLAERVGMSPGYMTQVSRGHRSMGVKVQARLESVLEAPATVAPAKRASVDRETVWDRMDGHGVSQNEVARRAGVSSGYLSAVMAGKATPSPAVLQRLHGVLYRRSRKRSGSFPQRYRWGWRKGERRRVVVLGTEARGEGGVMRVGGPVP